MGRHTYDGFAPVWSARSGDPFSDRMNALPKYVVSTTLTDPDWHNTTVIAATRSTRFATSSDSPAPTSCSTASGRSHAIMAAGLLDELRLWVHPFFVGTGTADGLLHRAGSAGRFDLVDAMSLDSGIVILTYRSKASRYRSPSLDRWCDGPDSRFRLPISGLGY